MLEAVEAAGLAVNPVCYPLNAYENRVYEVELADRSRVIAKFYRPTRWSEEQILEEHAFVGELAAEEIDVCACRPFPGGGTLRTIDGIHYGALRPQRRPRHRTSSATSWRERAGMLAARIHNVGARRTPPHRPRLTSDFYIRRNLEWMSEEGKHPGPPPAAQYRAVALALADLYDRLVSEGEGVAIHRIHGDLHVSNLLVRDGMLRTLDFDDMVVGPAVQDLWLCLPGRDAEARRLRESVPRRLRALPPLRPHDPAPDRAAAGPADRQLQRLDRPPLARPVLPAHLRRVRHRGVLGGRDARSSRTPWPPPAREIGERRADRRPGGRADQRRLLLGLGGRRD